MFPLSNKGYKKLLRKGTKQKNIENITKKSGSKVDVGKEIFWQFLTMSKNLQVPKFFQVRLNKQGLPLGVSLHPVKVEPDLQQPRLC